MQIIKSISSADVITLSNGLCGFLAIMYAIDGLFDISRMLILICIVLDGLDGITARALGAKHQFGRHLDSISDTVSFCFAPAVLIYKMYYISGYTSLTHPQNALAVVTSLSIVCFGILRLARFVSSTHRLRYFSGLPTPATAFFVVIVTYLPRVTHLFRIYLTPYIIMAATVVVSLLMITDIKYLKIRGKTGMLTGIVILTTVVLISAGVYWAVILPFGMIVVYIIGAPLYIEYLSGEEIVELSMDTGKSNG